MGLAFKKILDNGIEIVINDDKIQFIGTFDVLLSSNNFLKNIIDDIHKDILKKNIKSVYLDFSRLVFLNSSALKELVEWILTISNSKEEQKYSLIFIVNPEYLWQESSISTLMHLDSKVVKRENLH